MGGCCSSSRKPQLHGTPVFYYYSPGSEEQESLTSHDGVATLHSSGMLIDLNLNMSIPDTYRSPPPPIPYDVVLGRPQSTDVEPSYKKQSGIFIASSPKKVQELELMKSKQLSSLEANEEEDSCPTCLEEYDVENPKITTKCNHQFHLSCILEWMERSDTCPICNQEMIYEAL